MDLNKIDLLAKNDKPSLESYQMDVLESFRDFDEAVRYHGTPEMYRELKLLHNLAFEAVAKSFNQDELNDCIENFTQKIKDMAYFNGHMDTTIESLNTIKDAWLKAMFDIQEDWVFNGVFDSCDNKYELRVNVGRYNQVSGTVNLERQLTKRK